MSICSWNYFLGLGFECGLYVKDVKQRLIGEGHKMLQVGDYIMKVL